MESYDDGDQCRICIDAKGALSLREYTENTDVRLTYRVLIEECLRLDVRDAILPQFLCLSCAQELRNYYGFLTKARKNDIKLRAAFNLNSGGRLFKPNEELEAIVADDQQVGDFIKDPLEDSDFDITQELELDKNLNNYDDDSNYDEDDNKPLKHLIDAKEEKALLDTMPSSSGLQMGAKCDDDEEEEYITGDNMSDFLSAEQLLFPVGRYKCKLCGRAYFTTVGLQAHSEFHMEKSTVAKKKRVRGPNKKKRAAKSDVKEGQQEQATDQNPTSSIIQKTEAATADETAAETENETITGDQPVIRVRKQRPPKPKKIFPCHVCGKQMISASKLRYHMVMHTGEKDYLCSMCPKAYSTIYALKHHIRVHTGERPYECKFCGDRFLRPTTLKSHLRRHTGERPYGCNICGKRFIQHSSMTTHIKLNHMDKNIPCPHCDKKYARQTDLNTHLLSHTGDKPFSCKICPSRFIRQANLNKHMNQHHSGGEPKSNKPSTSRQRGAKKTATVSVSDQPAASTSVLSNSFVLQEQQKPSTVLNEISSQQVLNMDENNLLIMPPMDPAALYTSSTDMQSWNWTTQS